MSDASEVETTVGVGEDIGGVCLVTQPERSQTGKEHTRDLATIIAELTTIVVLTANVPEESTLGEEHEVVEYSTQGAGEHVLVEAIRFFGNQFRLCLAIRRRRESVVLFFGATAYLLPAVFARLIGKRVIVLPRGDVPLSLYLRWKRTLSEPVARGLAGLVSALERATYRTANTIVTYTPAMASELGLDRYGSKLKPHGARFVDTDQFNVQTPFDERARAVGFIGRLDTEKRVPELAEATKKLPEDVTFVFVGDGDYRELLEEKLSDEIEAGSVDLVGWVNREEVPEQLNRLQLLVVPSHPTEGLPTAILEAMACGTPAYATPVSGVPDVVREGETGFEMTATDSENIAVDIEEILSREDLVEMSRRCRQLIEDEYSFEAAVRRYDEILSGR